VEIKSTILKLNNKEFTISGDKEDASVLKMLARDGAYEPWIINLLQKVVLKKYYCLDIGANIGMFFIPFIPI
jgi:hypothetical protein